MDRCGAWVLHGRYLGHPRHAALNLVASQEDGQKRTGWWRRRFQAAHQSADSRQGHLDRGIQEDAAEWACANGSDRHRSQRDILGDGPRGAANVVLSRVSQQWLALPSKSSNSVQDFDGRLILPVSSSLREVECPSIMFMNFGIQR